MRREINLSGGEITLLKTMGLSGTPVYGKLLIERIGEMEKAEFLDELTGLISQGYVLCDKVNVRTMDDVDGADANPKSNHKTPKNLQPPRFNIEGTCCPLKFKGWSFLGTWGLGFGV